MAETIKLDVLKHLPDSYNKPIRLIQGEQGRVQPFRIFEGGAAYDLASKTVTFKAERRDGNVVIFACSATDAANGEVEATLPSALAAVEGRIENAYLEIRNSDGSIVAATQKFTIEVDRNVDISAGVAEEYSSAIDQMIADTQAALDSATDGANTAADTANQAADAANEATAKVDEAIASLDFSPVARAGVIYPFGGSVLPEGFLWCDGAAVSRTEYPELFAAIGTAYGAGDGSTTFNVPDLRGRVAMGASDAHPMGETGGEERHAQTVAEMPNHQHRIFWTNAYLATGQAPETGAYPVSLYDSTGSTVGGASGVFAVSEGGSQPFNVMQPYATTQYIISTGKGGGLDVAEVVQGITTLPLSVEYGGTGGSDLTSARRNLSYLGTNPIASTDEDTPDYWRKHGFSAAFFSSSLLLDQPTEWGWLTNIADTDTGNVWHEWRSTSTGQMFRRFGFGDAWGDWLATGGVDSIVAQGTSGVWTYRKWASGIAECWMTTTRTLTADGWASWGSIYEHETAFDPVSYPFEFLVIPSIHVSHSGASGSGSVYTLGIESGGGSKDITPLFRATRASVPNADINLCVGYYAIGRWK